MRKQGEGRTPQITAKQRKQLHANVAMNLPNVEPITSPDDLDSLAGYCTFASLSDNQMIVLKALVENVLSEDIQTDLQISKNIGLSERTMRYYRADLGFTIALNTAVMGVLKGMTDIWIHRIIQMAEKKNDWRAYQFLLELAGVYIPKRQQLNVNVDANAASTGRFSSLDDALDSVLTRLGELGWTPDDVKARMVTLKSQGAW